MTINHLLAFIGLGLIPALWVFLYHPACCVKQPSHKKTFGIMTSCLILLAVLAFAGIHGMAAVKTNHLMFVQDVSLSCPSKEDTKITAFMRKVVDRTTKDDQIGHIVFAKQAYVEKQLSPGFDPGPVQAQPDRSRTALGQAIQTAAGHMPGKGNNKIILMTDGHSNRDNAVDAANLASALGIEIFPVPLGSWSDNNEVFLQDLAAPRRIALHTPFQIRVNVSATTAGNGQLLIFKNKDLMVKKPVALKPGNNNFTFDDVLTASGAATYRAIINAVPDTVFENNEFVIVTTGLVDAGILYLTREPETAMARALETQGMAVDIQGPDQLPDSVNALLKYRGIVMDNIAATQFSYTDMENIRSFVSEAGGGLVMLGGDNSFGAGHWLNTPVEKVLPVSMDHLTTLENPEFCLVLIIDTSSSMGGYARNRTKLDGARTASFSAVELLNPFDRIGILGFDTEPYWVVPVTQASEREKIAAELSGLPAVGGTDLFPALSHAFETLKKEAAQKKHIIVLSDGKTSQADFKGLINAMTDKNITLSTVAVGSTSDRAMMKRIASWGRGRMYYTEDADNIPRIFTSDTRIASKETVYEAPMDTQLIEFKPFLQGLSLNQMPGVDGIVVTYPKPNAAVVFNTKKGPLLAVSQQGLGRSIAYTSAFDGRWGKNWVQWPGFERLVSQMMKWVQRAEPRSVYQEQILRKNGRTFFSVDVVDENNAFVNNANLILNLLLPSGQKRSIPLKQTAPGLYKCAFESDQTGQYLLTLYEDAVNPVLPTRTYYLGIPYSDEYRTCGVNHEILKKIAAVSGGRILGLDREVTPIFENKKDGAQQGRPLWPWFVGAFILVFVLNIAVRKIQELNG